jgi:subtilase family serine protease
VVCYSPAHLSQAYDFPTGKNAPTGAGQTIVIVTAYGSPFIGADLAQFDAENGLAAPPSFTTLYQQLPVSDQGSGDFQKWAIETSLDVEYAHAMAPGANIVLAVANSDDTTNVAQVEQEVLPQYPGAIVNQSFGVDEAGLFSDPDTAAALDKLYLSHVRTGGTVVAASGDLGASGIGPFVGGPPVPMAGYPAASPFVLSVGGTMGAPDAQGLWNNGQYGGEQAWNEQPVSFFPGAGAGGGAPSVIYKAPLWQHGMTGSSMRAEPDVSYNAAFNGGVVVVFHGRHGVVGGTSAGAPQWAAIVALANEVRGKRGLPSLGLATPQLWLLARDRQSYRKDFHDIVSGSNALGGPGSGLPGFDARPGYDFATGLGTPDVTRLLKDLSGRESVRFRFEDAGDSQHGDGNGEHGDKHVHFSAGG